MDQLNSSDAELLTDWLNNATKVLTKIESKPEYQQAIQAMAAGEPIHPSTLADLSLIQTLQRCSQAVSQVIKPEGQNDTRQP